MSTLENVSSAIEPEDRHRVRAIAGAILELQGYQASETLDLVITEGIPADAITPALARAESTVQLAAIIVNYLREEFEIPTPDHELLQALQREANL